MESGYVALSRTKGTTYYPAMFQMVMAANPCPCGYAYGNGERCVCKEKDRIRYFARLSGPILDRIDIQVEVPPVPCIASAPTRDSIGSHVMQQQVIDQRVIAVYFDKNRTVQRVANYGLQDGKIFDFISRTTPTSGQEMS